MTKASLPRFSVVLPTYARADLVGRAIRSVLQQCGPEFELIVVDDASSDATEATVGSFGDRRLAYARQQANRGVAAARNAGVARACGEWVTFLDDDDELMPGALQRVAAFLDRAGPEVSFTWGGVERCSTREVDGVAGSRSRVVHARDYLGAGTGYALTVRRDVLGGVGGFDESLRAGVDFDLLIRLGERYHGVPVPEVLVRVHMHEARQITDPTPEKSIAFERIAEKHREFFLTHPEVADSFWLKAARLAYSVGRRAPGRRLALCALRRRPLSWRRWKTLVALELLGREDLGLRRRLGLEGPSR